MPIADQATANFYLTFPGCIMPDPEKLKYLFDREVFCVQGLPFDALDMAQTTKKIQEDTRINRRCFLSTPNLNWLRLADKNEAFRNAAIYSDCSIADGMPVVWIARMLGIPITERVAGSDLINNLEGSSPDAPIRAFFFGGEQDAAEKAMHNINLTPSGLQAVGAINPGFGSVEEMSTPEIINAINQANADFLIVSLGSKKGQEWILHNRSALHTPVISHLGAVVNFYAKTVARAPAWTTNLGLEWLWRIYQEPKLFSRYFGDAFYLLNQLITRILPYCLFMRANAPRNHNEQTNQIIRLNESADSVVLKLEGCFAHPNLAPLKQACYQAIEIGKPIAVDLYNINYFDPATTGTLMILQKACFEQGLPLHFTHPNSTARKILKLQNAEQLLGNY